MKYPSLIATLSALTLSAAVLAEPATQPAAPTEPTIVSLQLEDATVDEALDALEEALGVSFTDSDDEFGMFIPNEVGIDVDLVDVPAIEAAREVLIKTGMSFQHGRLMPWGEAIWEGFPAAGDNWVRIEARSIDFSFNPHADLALDAAEHDGPGSLRINFFAMIDPKLTKFSDPELIVTHAIDDQGNKFDASSSQPVYGGSDSSPMLRQFAWGFEVDPHDRPKKIAELRGTISFSTVHATRDIVIDAPLETGFDFEVEGGRVTSDVMLIRNDMYRIDVTTTGIGAIADGDDFYTSLRIEYDNGESENCHTHDVIRDGDVVKTEVCFGSIDGTPVRLVWSIPTETETHEIPFEFKDLPLP